MTTHSQSTRNVDPVEIRKFEELASRWWDKNGEFKPLHDINPIRLNYINTGSPLKGKQVVDVGCGGGILTESMAGCGATVTGIDMGEAPLSVAKLHAIEKEIDIQYLHSTAEDHATNNPEKYDIVTCMEMLEHVPDPGSVIRACAELVKPGGSIYFSTINRNAKAFALAIVGAEYVMKLLPKGTHDYSKFIRPSELDLWARHADLEIKSIAGITYNPFTKMFRSSHDVEVNYMAHYKKPAS